MTGWVRCCACGRRIVPWAPGDDAVAFDTHADGVSLYWCRPCATVDPEVSAKIASMDRLSRKKARFYERLRQAPNVSQEWEVGP